MVLGGTCEVCQGGVCSCSDYNTFYAMYTWESWVRVGLMGAISMWMLSIF